MVTALMERLANAKQDSLRRAFSVWLDRVILARLKGERVRGTSNLWEGQTMLSERFDQWEAEFQQQGKTTLLLRQLRKRFGELPATVSSRLRAAQPEQLEEWGERLLDAASLNELFDDESVLARGSGNG